MNIRRCDVSISVVADIGFAVCVAICPSSSLIARLVGIEARFREHTVHVGNAGSAAGIGQAHIRSFGAEACGPG
jgi:hypothetical protein